MGDLKPINTNKAVSTQTITLTAVPENFAAAQEHVRSFLDSASCSMRTLFELDMVVEEVFINVASYAYPDSTGMVSLDLTLDEEQNFLCLTFRDSGLVQKYSDSLSYEYADGENRLTIGKKLD